VEAKMLRKVDRTRSKKDSVKPGTSEEGKTASAAAAPSDVHGSKDSSSDEDFASSMQRSKAINNGELWKQAEEVLVDSESNDEHHDQKRTRGRKAASNGNARRRQAASKGKARTTKEAPNQKESSEEEDLADSQSEDERDHDHDQQRTRPRESASKRQTRTARQALSRQESSEEEDTKVPARRRRTKKEYDSEEDADEGFLATIKRSGKAKSKSGQTRKGLQSRSYGRSRQPKDSDDEFLAKESEEDEGESEEKQSEEDFDPDADDEEEEGPLTSRKRNSETQARHARSGSRSKRHGKRRQSKDSDDEFLANESEEDEVESEDKASDDESKEDFDPHNEDEDEAPLSTLKRRSKTPARQTRRLSQRKRQTPSRASARKAAKNLAGLDDDEEPVLKGRRRSKRSKDDDAFVVGGEEEDSENHDRDDNEETAIVESGDENEESTRGLGRRQSPTSQRQSPSRAAALQASRKLASLKDDADDDDDDEPARTARRKPKRKPDDDEYEENDSGESDDDSDVADDESPEGDEDHVKKSKAVDVGDDFGTADDSSGDDEKRWESPQLKIKPSPGVLRLDQDDDSEDYNSGQFTALSPPKMPNCPSKIDVITEEELPRKHVCCFSPDGSSRQCFALETLHTIALTTPHPKFRQDLTGGKQTFLQPPHFRSEMSDDLLDQIASRFGREALDLRGPFYSRRREREDASSEDGENGYIVNYSEALADSNSFLERVGNYVQSQMGSRDIYACPVCYTVAHRKIVVEPIWNYDDDDEDDVETEVAKCYPVDFRFDPLTVLGSLKDFQVSASYCFKQVAKLKKHLRADHNVDTKCVQGNDLYERFKVRSSETCVRATTVFGSPFILLSSFRFAPQTDCCNGTCRWFTHIPNTATYFDTGTKATTLILSTFLTVSAM
jgi:hypothetical protein